MSKLNIDEKCSSKCYYFDIEMNECGIPIGLRTLRHCECGHCIKDRKEKKEGNIIGRTKMIEMLKIIQAHLGIIITDKTTKEEIIIAYNQARKELDKQLKKLQGENK